MRQGAGASTKFVFEHGTRIERVENVKDVSQYIARMDEMLARKREGIEKISVLGVRKVAEKIYINRKHFLNYSLKEQIDHGIRVSSLASGVARELGLEETLCYELAVAGVLHDIGKVILGSDIEAVKKSAGGGRDEICADACQDRL